jgi:hypothetical protein
MNRYFGDDIRSRDGDYILPGCMQTLAFCWNSRQIEEKLNSPSI